MRKSLLLALSLLGLWDSSYLWWAYTSPSRPMACLGSGCDAVRASPFAYPWGIPMPLFGVVMYAALALLLFAEPLVTARLARATCYAVAGISGAGFLFSLYLTGVAAFVLQAWCTWCTVSALSVAVIFALAIADLVRPAPYLEAAAALSAVRRYFAVFAGALGAGIPAFVLVSRLGTPPPVRPVSAQALAERLVRADSHMTGNLQSPVTVVEFGDFECPACAAAEETAREIRRKYGGRIRFVFRQFPLARLHPQSQKAAEASECAAEQGKFWEAVERLYQARGELSEAALVGYSGELGMDVARFRQCLTSGLMAVRVRRDLEDALALGLRATPTFFVGRQMIEGPLELGQFSRLVEQELAVSGASPAEAGVAPASTPRAKQAAEQRPPAGSSPGSSASLGSGGLLAGSVFTQLQGSAPGCSEEEALKQQPTLIQTPEARHLFEEQPKALFVDIRHVADYKSGRIPGAINIPPDEIERSWNRLPRGRDIVLYESGVSPGDICAATRAAGRTLLSHGFSLERVKVYQDGLAGWEKAGLPVGH